MRLLRIVPLTDVEKKFIQQTFLHGKLSCPACHNKAWRRDPERVSLAGMDLVAVVCDDCGFLNLFSADRMGLSPLKGTGP